jgi:uncharacterized membrane protein YidH (DUF202 family)
MTEKLLILLLLLLFSVGCWVLVIKKSVRYKFQKGAWRFYRLNRQEQRETHDAMYLAGVLVMALVFSVFFFVALVAAVLRQ